MEYALGNVYIREMRFDDRSVIEGHAHTFDHVTYVVRGALRIEKLELVDGGTHFPDGSAIAPTYKVVASIDKRASDGQNFVLIKAGVCHRIAALEPGSIGHCIYSHRTPQGDVVEQFNGWSPAHG